jgi:pimeloyl-ACP methyl ester carboxylesterase
MSDSERGAVRAALFAGCFLIHFATVSAADAGLDVYASPQKLVRLNDGRRMNIFCEGQGRPTVILEAGAGGSTLEWRQVQDELANATQVCAYDRAGMGFSDAGPMPRTAEAVVADLSALLHAANTKPPYVLVSHSLGSYFVRLYADRHPEEVTGMVLVDPSVEFQDQRFTEVNPSFGELIRKDDEMSHHCLQLAEAKQLRAGTPVFRDCTYGYAPDQTFSARLADQQIRRRLSVPFRAALYSESHEMGGADSQALAAARRSYGDMPLIILTQSPESADAYPGATAQQVNAMNRLWMQMHDELAALSTRGSNRLVAHSGHYIQKDRPDVVIAAVQEVIRDGRHEQPH